MKRYPRCFVFLLVTLLPALASARSADSRVFAVREMRVRGEGISDADRKLLTNETFAVLGALIQQAGAKLVNPDEVTRKLALHEPLLTCEEQACWARLGELLSADRLLTIYIDRDGGASEGPGEWYVRLASYATEPLADVVLYKLPCEVCNAETLISQKIIRRVLERAIKNERQIPLCKLRVESDPSDARVYLGSDSKEIGRTPFERTVEGDSTHSVSVEKASYAKAQAVVQCPANGKQPIFLALEPLKSSTTQAGTGGRAVVQSPPPPPPPADRRRLYLGLGGASAALAAGSLAWLIVEGVRFNDCVDSRCRRTRNTSVGLGISSVAAVGFAVGAAFLLHAGLRAQPKPPRVSLWVSPELSAQTAGVTVGGIF